MTAIAAAAAALWCLVFAVDLVRARARWKRWPVLPSAAESTPEDDLRFVIAPGVSLDERVRRAAASYMQVANLDSLDLIPGDLPVAAALEIAGIVDPAALARDPFARTAGAGHVLVARAELVRRAAIEVPCEATTIAAAAEALRRFATDRTGTAIASGLRAVPEASSARASMLRARTGATMGLLLYFQGLRWLLLLIALVADARIGFVLLALASILPSAIFAGLPIRPGDRLRSMVERLPRDLIAWLRGCLQDDNRTAAVNARRARYAALLCDGTAAFFDARRDRCPHCGDVRLTRHVVTTDLIQRKPGQFVLERCAGCALIFQNPALSARGLDFYYGDFYDGVNAEFADEMFASLHAQYAPRATAVIATLPTGATPARWLDVGCGYAHFSLAAKQRLPMTRFEGLDRSDSVEIALARGWIERAWRGDMEALARSDNRFEVVSLFHCLEHTLDPAGELRAAAELLTPEGRFILEIPNPRCRLGSLAGPLVVPVVPAAASAAARRARGASTACRRRDGRDVGAVRDDRARRVARHDARGPAPLRARRCAMGAASERCAPGPRHRHLGRCLPAVCAGACRRCWLRHASSVSGDIKCAAGRGVTRSRRACGGSRRLR